MESSEVDYTIKPLSCLFLVIILFFGLSFQVSYVSCARTPSVPEFTVKLVAYPYDVPTTNTTIINPYTGNETVITTPGYHVENRSIEVWIKNQPFTPYTDSEGNEINLYYNVRAKGHFEDDWKIVVGKSPIRTSLEYNFYRLSADYPEGGQVDFQVRAVVAYKYNTLAGRPIIPLYALRNVGSSDWSSTQTLTIENPEIIPEFPSWFIFPMVIVSTLAIIGPRNRFQRKKLE